MVNMNHSAPKAGAESWTRRPRDPKGLAAERKTGGIARQSNNVVWSNATVMPQSRERLNGHRAFVIWFTGLSGAGKTTLAYAIDEALHHRACHSFVVDGDNLRHGLCSDLGFSPEDRRQNLRRAGELARLFVEAGTICLAAFISPLRADRELVRSIVGAERFIEIYVSCPLDVCELRDVKDLYRRARAGEISEFTGISAPYEPPQAPDLVIDTTNLSIIESVSMIVDFLDTKQLLQHGPANAANRLQSEK